MAAVSFAPGDVVSMTLQAKEGLSGLLGPLVQTQPPTFGVVTDGDGGPPFTTVDVLWEDGRLVPAIPVAAVDLIGLPDAGVVASLQGFVLKTNPAVDAQQESPEYQGTAVTFYTRQNGDSQVADPTDTLCLMRVYGGTYRELLASTLKAVAGR